MVELLKRGTDLKARDELGRDSLWLASRNRHVAIATIILGRGCDPNTRNNHCTALGIAAFFDYLPVCILLLSKGADLYATMPIDGRTALQCYGDNNPHLTPAVLEQRRALLQHAYDEGPHPNACWARRWPFMQVLVFNELSEHIKSSHVKSIKGSSGPCHTFIVSVQVKREAGKWKRSTVEYKSRERVEERKAYQ